jgi:hypothetical protein
MLAKPSDRVSCIVLEGARLPLPGSPKPLIEAVGGPPRSQSGDISGARFWQNAY